MLFIGLQQLCICFDAVICHEKGDANASANRNAQTMFTRPTRDKRGGRSGSCAGDTRSLTNKTKELNTRSKSKKIKTWMAAKTFDKRNFREVNIIWQKNCTLATESITLIVEYSAS